MRRTRTDSGGSWFRRRRLPGRLGVVGISRLLVFQVIQVGLFVVLVQGIWAAILGSTVGGLAIAVAFGRWRGRWFTEHLAIWFRFRQRRGVVATPVEDPRLASLAELVPDLVVEEVDGPDQTRLGMGSDGAGWFAVLEVKPADTGVAPPAPLGALARIAAEAGPAGAVVQVVAHTMPAVGSRPGRQRLLWVAVRLDAELVAAATVDGPRDRADHPGSGPPSAPGNSDPARAGAAGSDDAGGGSAGTGAARPEVDVPAILAELTRRARRTLNRRGLDARVLDQDGLIDALVYSCDLVIPDGRRCHEAWQAWYSHRLVHRCYWLQSWPDPDRATSLLASLTDLPDTRVSLALVLEPWSEGEADLRCLIRLAAPSDRSPQVCRYAENLVRSWGGRLFPLDGEQALAVYGSAPTGGGAR